MLTAILKRAAQKAGINKRVHPHLLRHSRATQLANIMSDSQLKHYLGWTQGSKMAGIYVHMSRKDTDEAVLRANGITIEAEKKTSSLKPLICLMCGSINPAAHRFCNTCSFALDEETQNEVLVRESQSEDVNKLTNALFKNKEIVALVAQKIKEVKL